ncbi:outer membrane protein [Bradyrhizobium glycinis]|uniref:outer membrane protein n=1 Tax=Bradyrhizobium glycinis TaxID=2751812 RepID=UPI0018D9F657|nr:outer membrane beta-barrel protein [Bradyrhizobium glycinis]MBH5371264.1 porin family protein [Bradyrhizobium glycinis]
MKKLLLASASLFALAAPASAADLAARPYTKAPVAVASVYNWSGFYIGANAGGGSSRNCWDLTSVGGVAITPVAEGCHNATGAVVGGQVGYRWQSASWVFGLEAQGDWADLKGSNTSSPAALFPLVNNTKIDAIGLFTGQVGYAWNNVLWYVKGGAAVTHNKFSGTLAGVTLDTANETRWGGTVGTGIEFGFAPNWSVAVEYNHLFMGKHTDNFTFLGVNTRGDSIKQDVDMGTVRLNYTFGGPVVAKY